MPASLQMRIEPAITGDVPLIVALVTELAEFERLAHEVRIDADRLHEHLFGPRPYAEAAMVRLGTETVGFALWFHNYSTFLGQPGLYLEDLYVQPHHRGSGLGKALLEHLGALAVERDCGRFEWSVLDWNETAIGFYQRMGAQVMPDWRICRVAGDALEQFRR